jgi:hypothetical protein
MVVRVVRAVTGSVLLLVGIPLLLAGGVLWFAMQHQDPAGGYSARVATISTDGYAVVASDVDGLLRREAPFARGGRTTLRLTARTETGPAFVGLAPAADVARYLTGVPYARVEQVRLARGPLPVSAAAVAGADVAGADRALATPAEQPFWLASSGAGTLEWRPNELRGEQLALVVMDPAAAPAGAVDLTAHLHPEWLGSTAVGLLVLGAVLVVVAVAALAWPRREREIIYVVPPAQMPEIAAHLGVPVPRLAADPRPPAAPASIPAPAAPESDHPDPRTPDSGTPEPEVEPAAAPEPAAESGSGLDPDPDLELDPDPNPDPNPNPEPAPGPVPAVSLVPPRLEWPPTTPATDPVAQPAADLR